MFTACMLYIYSYIYSMYVLGRLWKQEKLSNNFVKRWVKGLKGCFTSKDWKTSHAKPKDVIWVFCLCLKKSPAAIS